VCAAARGTEGAVVRVSLARVPALAQVAGGDLPGRPPERLRPRARDVTAAAAHLRALTGAARTCTIGFCMGGRLAFLSAGFGLGLAGVIGFYGWPVGPARNGTPAPADGAATFESPVPGGFRGPIWSAGTLLRARSFTDNRGPGCCEA